MCSLLKVPNLTGKNATFLFVNYGEKQIISLKRTAKDLSFFFPETQPQNLHYDMMFNHATVEKNRTGVRWIKLVI